MSKLFEACFSEERWTKVIERGVDKDINREILSKFCNSTKRIELAEAIAYGKYKCSPPHEARIPKDKPGEYRTVYVGTPEDRILMAVINDALLDVFGKEMIHQSCKSYQKNIGCGRTVQEMSKVITTVGKGIKSDFYHYFDTVKIEAIENLFDTLERRLGYSTGDEPIINLLRKTWRDNRVIDINGNMVEKYMGIRQGNAVGAFLANAILYELDNYMTKHYKYYVRYSDDIIVLTKDTKKALKDMKTISTKYGVSINPKKIEYLSKDKWFTFLGYNVRGEIISLNKKWIKYFQKEIQKRTTRIANKRISLKQAVKGIVQFLYIGNGEYSWATSVLPYINSKEDIRILNEYVMDCIRATQTRKTKIGGIGMVVHRKDGCIDRDFRKHAGTNKYRTEKEISGYISLAGMKSALCTNRALYEMLVNNMLAA